MVLTYDLRKSGKGSALMTRLDRKGIKGMALNPLEPNYFFICGDTPVLDLYDTRRVDFPVSR